VVVSCTGRQINGSAAQSFDIPGADSHYVYVLAFLVKIPKSLPTTKGMDVLDTKPGIAMRMKSLL
jgi:hypothetical protein